MVGIAKVGCAGARGWEDDFKIPGRTWRAMMRVEGAERGDVVNGRDGVAGVELTVGRVEGVNVRY